MKKPIVNLLGEKSGEAVAKRPIVNIWNEETGAAAAEYAMIVAVVGLGIGAASLALGGNIGWAGANQSDALYNMNFEPGGSSGGGSPPPPPPPPPPPCKGNPKNC